MKKSILKTFRFSENLTHLFFLLSWHKFSSIATVVNFNEEKREKKKIKIRKPKCLDYISALLLIFISFTLQAQQRNIDRTNFRAGLNGGIVVDNFSESYSLALGVDIYNHWGVSKALDIGITTGFFNAFGEKESVSVGVIEETEFANIQYLPVGASLRIYPSSDFKFGGDIGYAVGINKENQGALYYRPSLGIDMRNGSSELNISYFAVNDDVTFSSVLLGYLILF